MRMRLSEFPTNHPRFIALSMVAIALLFPALVALPTLWPETFPFLSGVEVDTDPENMLSDREAVRVFHNEMKKVLSLNDIVVVGVVNETHPDGVFNVDSLADIYSLTEYAKTLRGAALDEPDADAGVVEIDVIAPSTVDNIEPGEIGVVRFEWLMPKPPATAEEALAVRDKALRIPFLNGTLVSEDGKAIALYLPLTSKDLSYKVYTKLKAKIAEFSGDDRYHITGLPVAEDIFGAEMFKQMAMTAPAAMLVIFLLLFVFFRKLVLIISPMIIALVSVIFTMGLLIVTGNTIHIMSSMIPIFIMPIAVLDSVHILSEFFDRYQKTKDRRKTIVDVMRSLFVPMLYTSLTSAAGFASLALTPIPPVQVFGVFIAIGVLAAWFFTIMFVPAYVMLIPERSFANFGMVHSEEGKGHAGGLSGAILGGMRRFTYSQAKWVLAGTLLLACVAVYGITRIEINDNPTRWFKYSHPIRVADRVLNEHFGGTYMAYLAFEAQEDEQSVEDYAAGLRQRLREGAGDVEASTPEAAQVLDSVIGQLDEVVESAADADEVVESLAEFVAGRMESAEDDVYYDWEEFDIFLGVEKQRGEVFKQPAVLEYIGDIQEHLLTTGVVGKSNSLADIVKTVHRELFEGSPEKFSIPDTSQAVAQCLITFEGGHRPHDLYHFVTPDYRQTNIWVQLKSGDNRDMSRVVSAVDRYIAENPPPHNVTYDWFGLTYINVVWQDKMVSGMLRAIAGSFLVVLLMMLVLFRSGLWAILSMVPLTVTIGLIYGVIGLVGKDYDMPVAVLSSLTLGLAVDFAIHFLARSRAIYEKDGNWQDASEHVFGEPARAISRNVIIIAVGFLPLLAATLMPYRTVGVLLAAILLVSGGGTLLILPSLIRYGEGFLFPTSGRAAAVDRCVTIVVVVLSVLGLLGLNVRQFTSAGPAAIAATSGAALAVAAIGCLVVLRKENTKTSSLGVSDETKRGD